MGTQDFTPGPWTVASEYHVFSVDAEGHIARGVAWTASNSRTRTKESAANARLIAAAPELLSACRDLLAWDGAVGSPVKPLPAILATMRSLLQSATGEDAT